MYRLCERALSVHQQLDFETFTLSVTVLYLFHSGHQRVAFTQGLCEDSELVTFTFVLHFENGCVVSQYNDIS